VLEEETLLIGSHHILMLLTFKMTRNALPAATYFEALKS
jgi:hypothetical protein